MIIAKKSLGQNFLIDKNIIDIICNVIDINNKTVLEIGPGTGNLTSSLIKKKPKKLFVVEKDNQLASLLKKNFDKEIINEDILNINEKEFSQDRLIVYGNLPYNISTELLCKWILNLKNSNFWFQNLVLMFQKEVAERIIANVNTSNYGRLTVLAKWKMDIKKICDIQPSSFSPRPKIDSSLLVFTPKTKFFEINEPNNLEKITRIFFNQRRKMLKKPYKILFSNNVDILKKLKIDLNLRPQNLDFQTYYKLAIEYENLKS